MTHLLARRSRWNKKRVSFAVVVGLALTFLMHVSSERSLGGSIQQATHETTMRIYFIPFAAETLLGVTMDTIDEAGEYKIWFIHESPLAPKEHPAILKLRRLLLSKKGTSTIDNSFIRLKVELQNDTFYVDKNGTVLRKNTG